MNQNPQPVDHDEPTSQDLAEARRFLRDYCRMCSIPMHTALRCAFTNDLGPVMYRAFNFLRAEANLPPLPPYNGDT